MTTGTPGFVGARLTQARQAFGLSKVALSEMLGVTPGAVTHYETGRPTPRPDVLDRLVNKLGFDREFYMRPAPADDSEPIFWRSTTTATKTARERSSCRLGWLKEIASYLLQHFDFPPLALPEFALPDDFRELSFARIENLAQECREWWNFGSGPIPDLLLELENSGCVVAKINLDADTLDAFSQWSSSMTHPFVILGRDKASAVRSRFDAAHELAHLLLHRNVDRRRINSAKDFQMLEQQAHRFSAAFLLPAKSFADDLWMPTLDAMAARKQRWNVSIAMMIKRVEVLGMVDSDQARRMWINYTRRGWRNEEPFDATIEPERPRLLRRSIEALVTEGIRTREQIVDDLALPPREIEEIASLGVGYLSGRQADIKAFPKLKAVRSEPARPEGSAEVIQLRDRIRET